MARAALIIGGGPAGLTAAYELLTRTDIVPIVLEQDPEYVGGISRTVTYGGNRIDIGGHRFFSKSDRVMQWWAKMLPVALPGEATITYRNAVTSLTEGLPRASEADGDRVMLVRPRTSRIIYGGEFFPYPIELSFSTLRKLGIVKVAKILWTYAYAAIFPRRPEKTLEDFFINRFGTELYKTFFKSYTEKVWGVPCTELSAEWGAQRVKGVSIMKAGLHMLSKATGIGGSGKAVETSLIEQFLYPAYGPGFMWETVAEKVRTLGGDIRMGAKVTGLTVAGDRVTGVEVAYADGRTETCTGDFVFSTTDLRALIAGMEGDVPASVREIAHGLEYRDFLTVGLVLSAPPTDSWGQPIHDTWIYVHEPGVQVGRIQFFHNWSPHLVDDPAHGHVGLEYFCAEGDALWMKDETELRALGEAELRSLGLLGEAEVLDGVVVRQPKAYPGYFGTYDHIDEVRAYVDRIENLYLLGRNGMHRYNNQDHSMLTAMTAVDLIAEGKRDKAPLWNVNTEQEYHEQK